MQPDYPQYPPYYPYPLLNQPIQPVPQEPQPPAPFTWDLDLPYNPVNPPIYHHDSSSPNILLRPDMGRNLRSSRGSVPHKSSSQASGSEYHMSDPMEQDAGEEEPQEPPPDEVEYTESRRGRRIQKKSYLEPDTVTDEDAEGEPDPDHEPITVDDEQEEEEDAPRRLRPRNTASRNLLGFIDSDDDGEAAVKRPQRKAATKKSSAPPPNTRTTRSSNSRPAHKLRRGRSAKNDDDDEDGYVDEGVSSGTADADLSGDIVQTTPEPEEETEQDGRPYSLRKRDATINYKIPPPLDPVEAETVAKRARTKGKSAPAKRKGGLNWAPSGGDLGQFFGLPMPADDSDSDNPQQSLRKPFGGASGGMFAGSVGAAGMMAGDLATSGAPSNLGKIGDTALADADPLGVNQNVTFDEVGGLDDHINALKEMTLLPLLYPEVFQRFDVTPPRGVLFHGPPGTGKTLLARALAASSRSNGRGISFFMRKGADCLSKWVGEAERQLRLLFEEARNCQPSIIFFDEIDGLAPVRSSKQDQIHASIVSTLLALMDGMDGRGQVVVIGATNRPDAVDPALRRPGRFDREFYFPLPNLDARERIIRINTHKWAGWEGDKGEEHCKGLAKLTKGYGGADIRALCTEAALNAVQRRYPQIYKSNDRLLLSPETINVQLRDFMISVNKLVPSSARSAASTSNPLPSQLVPLLSSPLESAKNIVAKVMPVSKKRTALEEAEWEDEGEDGAFDREMMLQSMESLRIYRPRIILHGMSGMGQGYVAAALLHHLEGWHVQSLDLGSLMNDSTRTVEAAIVQLFVEAKRHKPSVVYIPSLVGWCAAVSETSRSTVRAMLDTLAPTDPVLLLAVVDGSFSSLPRDVRAWFGPTRENRVEVSKPDFGQREAFFEPLLLDVRRPPNQFPDGVKRNKRVLEVLPIAPPVQPRQLTDTELAMQEGNDQRVITLLKYRLGPILTELKRKFKRFTKSASEEYNLDVDVVNDVQTIEPPLVPAPEVEMVAHTHTIEIHSGPNGITQVMDEQQTHMEQTSQIPIINGVDHLLDPTPVPVPVIEALPPVVQQPKPRIYEMDLERMHVDLYKSKYLTPHDFLTDIRKIAHNASAYADEDPDRLFKAHSLLTTAEVSMQDFDQAFQMECEKMAVRERKRRDDRKKQRALNKETRENEAASDAPNAPRRSGRNNGKQPELELTDPLQLERRLKRQRSNDDGGAIDRQSSSEETGEGRTMKRSRITSDEDENDPLDLILPKSPHPRSNTVHFVDQAPIVQPSFDQDGVEQSPRKGGGFDPALLNPLPSPNDPMSSILPLANGIIPSGSSTPMMSIPQRLNSPNPFVSTIPMDQQPSTAPEKLPQELEKESRASIPPAATNPSPLPVPQEPMVIERTPTPLPDFDIDEGQLSQLKDLLCSRTQPLNVEELEQLRATCLGAVWRHRTDWNREKVIRELMDIANEFVQEVSMDSMSMSP